MSAEDNKEIVRRFIEDVINGKNVAAVGRYVADDFVDHAALPGAPPGLEGFKQFLAMACKAFPDVRWTTEDMIAEEDRVMTRGICSGTHSGEFHWNAGPNSGIDATGKQVSVNEVHVVRMAGGKMVEHWENVDFLGMLQQLGALPPQG